MTDGSPGRVGDGGRVRGGKQRESRVGEKRVNVEVGMTRVTPLLDATGLEEDELHVRGAGKKRKIVDVSLGEVEKREGEKKEGKRDEQSPGVPFDLVAVRVDDEGSVEQADRKRRIESQLWVPGRDEEGTTYT